MKRHADIYDGYRAKDWLERQHINKVRREIRKARKRESQLLLGLELPEQTKRKDKREHAVNP